jgi:hypothetical protein
MSEAKTTLQRYNSDVGKKSLGDDLDGMAEINLRTSSSLTGGRGVKSVVGVGIIVFVPLCTRAAVTS